MDQRTRLAPLPADRDPAPTARRDRIRFAVGQAALPHHFDRFSA
jgi:hypothetical protein